MFTCTRSFYLDTERRHNSDEGIPLPGGKNAFVRAFLALLPCGVKGAGRARARC
jgi:hypothetical protein